jgi:hypothetical protein
MKPRAIALAVVGALTGALLVGGVATAVPGNGNGNGPKNDTAPNGNGPKSSKPNKGKKSKATICHRTGNGTYRAIRPSQKSHKAHLRHGDKFPGDAVPGGTLNNQCQVEAPAPQRFTSPVLSFGPNGWAGWSCPSGMKAVGGGHTLADVQAEGVAQPGATFGNPPATYPTYPHYTFSAGETGYVVQNDNDTDSGTVFVDCVPV